MRSIILTYTLLIPPVIDLNNYMNPNEELIKILEDDTNITSKISVGCYSYIIIDSIEEYFYIKLKYSELREDIPCIK